MHPHTHIRCAEKKCLESRRHTSLRRMATSNITRRFKAFPNLEKDAINAMYDLCEDQDSNIRIGIQGYRADVRGAA
ncbi:hypothetical protein EDB87DRAFT_1631335 [Lactarius vividus]|nr:hypothetical protein EDB87DRAFT_1631335 [Lactarius vividus]